MNEVRYERLRDPTWDEFVGKLRGGSKVPFAEHWQKFLECSATRRAADGPLMVYWPSPETLDQSNLEAFQLKLGIASYGELYRWSVSDLEAFWSEVLEHLGIVLHQAPSSVLDLTGGVKQPRWLADASLNIVTSCFLAAPQDVAIIAGREGSDALTRITYGELQQMVARVAHGLGDLGFAPGDGIALYMPMTVECVAAYLGIIASGCHVVSIAESFPPNEVRKRLQISDARGIVTTDRFLRSGKAFPLFAQAVAAGAPRAVVVQEGDTAVELRQGDTLWADAFGMDAEFTTVAGDPQRITNILFSSGTTGTPKALPWNHVTPLRCSMEGHFHQDLRPGGVVCWPTSIGWMMGPWLIYASLINRGTIALYNGAANSPGFARFVQESRVQMMGVVPALVRSWRQNGALDEVDWRGVRVFSSTGEASNREDYLWLMSTTDYRAPVLECCGGTEIGGGYLVGTMIQPASPTVFTSQALGSRMVILDDHGEPVEEGQHGEVFLVPPSLGFSQEVLNKDHEEIYYDGCPRGPNGEVLRRHGDRITRLPGGMFRAEGRVDDVMNLGGIKIGPVEIENVVDSHAAVAESAAVGVRAGNEGADRLVLYVCPRQDTDTETLKSELRSLIADRLNPLFKLHDLVIIEQLPRTATNKLMRRELRDRYAVDEGRRVEDGNR